jgi:HEAT repeat protein
VEHFEEMLSGGHPNSLGRTVEVVDHVIGDRSRLDELLACYQSQDPVVRLRTSNAIKRIEAQRHDWLVPLIDRLLDDVGAVDQASAQWTLAQLLLRLGPDLSPAQRTRAVSLLQANLEHQTDWIVLNTTMETLHEWSLTNPDLRAWLEPHLRRLTGDSRKSVRGKANKLLAVGN